MSYNEQELDARLLIADFHRAFKILPNSALVLRVLGDAGFNDYIKAIAALEKLWRDVSNVRCR
jgi:hypothetical protein